MALEQACIEQIPKLWGSTHLLPWSGTGHNSVPIGELRFQRCDEHAPEPALLLKLLFTQEPLSIQVHPDDAAAHGMGLPRGKTEAWYILSAASDAAVERRRGAGRAWARCARARYISRANGHRR